MQKTIIILSILIISLLACNSNGRSSKYEGVWERVRKRSLADSQMLEIKKVGDHFFVKHFRSDIADTVGIPDSAYFDEQGLLLLKNGGNILYLPETKHIVVYGIEHQRKSKN